MTLLLAGLAIFIAGHLVTTRRELRAGLIARFGEGPYKGLYSLVAFIGLALIVVGFGRYRAAGYIDVWDPPRWTRHVTITLMWPAFVAIAAAYAPHGKIAGWLRHPMLNGVKTWATAHLIANGDLGSIILFGSILAWTGYDRFSLKWRGDTGAPRVPTFAAGDWIALGVGTAAWIGMMFLHPYVIGVAVIGV